MPEEQDAQVNPLAPLVRPDRPVPVTVWDAGEWWPGAVTAWRGDRVMAEYIKGPGMRHVARLLADRIRRTEESPADGVD